MLSSGSADTRGAVGVEGCPTGGVDIGVTDARRAVSRGVTQNSAHTCYLATCTSRVSELPGANKTRLRKDGLHVRKKNKKAEMRRDMFFTAHIVIDIHPYTGYPIRPLEPPGYR